MPSMRMMPFSSCGARKTLAAVFFFHYLDDIPTSALDPSESSYRLLPSLSRPPIGAALELPAASPLATFSPRREKRLDLV
jgi:hypothetical protein